ncbi:MAG: 8-oxo-dGTP diphosphatase [SAR324 cluster bacterium]|nr:8-oxo-dGTP diphosphatase [SAR324 cluster bacterium]
MKFEDIDWKNWTAKDRATQVFIVRNAKILMIHRKMGMGVGKISGPGGRIEKGETPIECAVREVQEEICVTPKGIQQLGELRFQFVDGYSLHGYAFLASDCEGVPQETEEADPFWVSVHEIPYEKMWADDHLWMPMMLEGKSFSGRFLFDGDEMLGYQIDSC